jgi:hypothetical protein
MPVTSAAVVVARATPAVPVCVPDCVPEVVMEVPARAFAIVVAIWKVLVVIEEGTT